MQCISQAAVLSNVNERLIVHIILIVVHWHIWPKGEKNIFLLELNSDFLVTQLHKILKQSKRDQDLHFAKICFAITFIVLNKSKEAITCLNFFNAYYHRLLVLKQYFHGIIGVVWLGEILLHMRFCTR